MAGHRRETGHERGRQKIRRKHNHPYASVKRHDRYFSRCDPFCSPQFLRVPGSLAGEILAMQYTLETLEPDRLDKSIITDDRECKQMAHGKRNLCNVTGSLI